MKALIATGQCELPVALADISVPRPKPGEALVKVAAFSVNRGEIFLLEDSPAGARPGKDIAGVVVQTAAHGSGPVTGQRVVGHPETGGWAEYAAVPVSSMTSIPDSVPAVQAAALPLAGLTALRLLRTVGDVTGRRILLTGASGGVGHYFTELAANAGAEVTAVTSSAERGQQLIRLGAAAVVHDIAATDGQFHVVLESTGGENTPLALDRLVHRGTLIWFGQASRRPATLSFFDIRDGPGSVTIRQFSYYDFDTPYGEDLAILVRLVATGRLHPEIGRMADWSDTAATLTDLYQRRIRGNAVLTISPGGATAMTPAEPASVVVRYVEAVSDGNIDAVRGLFAEDATWEYPGDLPLSRTWRGRDAIVGDFLGGVRTLLRPAAPLTIELTNVISDGPQVVAEWTSSATARDGGAYNNRNIGVFAVLDGKITSVREYTDTQHVEHVLFGQR